MKQRFALFLQNVNWKSDTQKACFASSKAMAVAEGKCSNYISTFLIKQ